MFERLTKRILPTAVAIAAGLPVLLGYLVPSPLLAFVRDQLIRWAVILAGFAFILGFFNVLRVHLGRISRGGANSFYSGALILSALASLGVTIGGLIYPPASVISNWWFRYILSPLQGSAAALIAPALGLSAFRLLRNRRDAGALWFLLAAILVLLGTLPPSGIAGEWLAQIREWWITVFAMAGMRGLLLGVGLGTLLVGLRVLIGVDRPHSEL